MSTILDQLKAMLGNLQVGNNSNADKSTDGHANVNRRSQRRGDDFQVKASGMQRYQPDLPAGTQHLPTQEQGCSICGAKKSIFGGLVDHIH